MKYTNKIFKKTAVLEEYLPLSIKSESSLENANYLIFRYENNSLLEIVFNESNGYIHKINMIICKDYHMVDSTFDIPNDLITKKGDILVEREDDVTTHKFECIIYKDAIRLEISNEAVIERIYSDNIVWELNKDGKLVSFTLYRQSPEIIEHTKNELSYDNQ